MYYRLSASRLGQRRMSTTQRDFPLFKITLDEACALVFARGPLTKGSQCMLCTTIQSLPPLFASAKVKYSLRAKLCKSLEGYSHLCAYVGHSYYDPKLRVRWIKALLKYNGYE